MATGYTMDVERTETAATAIGDDATYAKSAITSLAAVPKPAAPAAGEGIGAELAAFQTGWNDVLTAVGTELTAMSGKVSATKNVTVKVEQEVRGRFHQFAQ